MAADFPVRHVCGGRLTRLYTTAPAVHYAAGGFYTTDVNRLKNQVGPERFAKFEREKAAAEQRAATNTQTPYERALTAAERTHA